MVLPATRRLATTTLHHHHALTGRLASACGRQVQVPTSQQQVIGARTFFSFFKSNLTLPDTPEKALAELWAGNKRFIEGQVKPNHPTRSLKRVAEVVSGQAPFAAFLSCADSRVPVEIVFDQGFGDVFVTRVAGNIVTNQIMGSLEFGTAVLGAKILMGLGHSKCGAVAATMGGSNVPGVISSLYYKIAQATGKCTDPRHLDHCIADNVKHQVEQLKVSPVLQGLVKEGKLKIIGAVFK